MRTLPPPPPLPAYLLHCLNIAHCWGDTSAKVCNSFPALSLNTTSASHHNITPCNWDFHTQGVHLKKDLRKKITFNNVCIFSMEQILSCAVRIQSDWMDWYFQTIARVKNLSCFRIMAVTVGAEFLSSLNKTWRQFSQFNLFERAPKIYPWLPLVAIISELSMCPLQKADRILFIWMQAPQMSLESII